MIKITFYNFQKKVNSTAIPSGTGTELDCNIKAPSSIVNPVLEIATQNCINYNYCYIPAFNRYYFIDDIVFNRGIWILSCSVDVLASYKTEIGASSCYVLRSSTASDGDIIDTRYPITTDKTTSWLNPDINPFTWSGFNSGFYVIGLQGNNNYAVNGSLYYQLTAAEFSKFLKNFYADSSQQTWGGLDQGIINSMMNITDYITSCRWYPASFNVDVSDPQTIYVGNFNTGATGYLVKEYPLTVLTWQFSNIPKHPKASARGNYLNCAPYSKYVLRSGFTGTIPLDSFVMKECTNLAIELFVDVSTGQARVWILADGNMFVETFGQFGVDVNLSGTEINIGGALGSGLAAIGSFVVDDYLGAARSVGNGLSAMQPQVVGKASSGGYVQMYMPFSLMIDFYDVVDEDNADQGRPYCKMTTPATLTGFMIINDPHIAIDGTSLEANQINAYMAGGFFYE